MSYVDAVGLRTRCLETGSGKDAPTFNKLTLDFLTG